MKHNKRHDPTASKDNRKTLRKNLTPAEAFLWKQLQEKKLSGRKFRRQHGIDRYIVDFYCAKEALIIELDGEVHMNATAEEYDNIRTGYLEKLGFKILRFENKMVFENLPSVLMEIRDSFKLKMIHIHVPSPSRGRWIAAEPARRKGLSADLSPYTKSF